MQPELLTPYRISQYRFRVVGATPRPATERIVKIGRINRIAWPTETTKWKNKISHRLKYLLKTEGPPPWDPTDANLAFEVYYEFDMPKPTTSPGNRRRLPNVKPDYGKLARPVDDAMAGLLYKDDAQIVRAQITLQYALTPQDVGVKITVYQA